MYLIPRIGMFELPAAGGGYLFTGGLFDGPVTAGFKAAWATQRSGSIGAGRGH